MRRIGELKQLCLARLRGCRSGAERVLGDIIAVRLRACRGSIARFLAKTFPERQILVRELDRISVFRLGRGLQLGLAAFAIVASGWAIAVVVGMVFAGQPGRGRDGSSVVALQLEPAPRRAPVIAEIAAALPADGEPAAVVPVPAAEPPLEDLAGELFEDEEPVEQAAAEPAEEAAELPAGEPAGELAEASINADVRGVSAAPADAADAARSCAHLAEEARQRAGAGDAVLERLRAQLAAVSERVFALATRGLGAPAPAEDARHARGLEEEGETAALAQMASLERHVDRLATGVSALRSAETDLLREVQPQLAYFIETAERVIERAGMDLDDVFQEGTKPRRSAKGGPFIAAISGPLAAERAALQSDLAYWQALRALVKRMPLAAPLDRYAISSSYGTRRDPLNNRQAMHHGIDLISAPNASIRAPAPGIVVFAGRNGGYGNMVEIDHGRSLRTRYAHLRTIKVKAGEKVAFQQNLGTLGNSGRSTGAHLHYEILIAGKPADPLNFIKAGQHVFQE